LATPESHIKFNEILKEIFSNFGGIFVNFGGNFISFGGNFINFGGNFFNLIIFLYLIKFYI